MRGHTRHLLSCFSGILTDVRSDRLLATLLLLQTHGRLPAPEIARRLEVSPRTVARDVEALSAAGVPVYCERGRSGGVVLVEGYRTDVTGMTDDEMRALVALAGSGGTGALGPALASASRKLLAALPEARRDGVDRARRRLLVEQQGWRRGPEEVPMLAPLDAALVADVRVRLRYATADRGTAAGSWRTVDPYGLVAKAGTWYLVAAHRGQPRMYRVSRVREVAATTTPARRPDDRTLAEVWSELRDRLEAPVEGLDVRVRVDPEWLATLHRVVAPQMVGSWVDEGTTTGGAPVLRGRFRNEGAARAALLSFADTVEVLDPPALREQMHAAAERVVALYRSG
jgi:predicted DNA-binding transcriptional regulator YafY